MVVVSFFKLDELDGGPGLGLCGLWQMRCHTEGLPPTRDERPWHVQTWSRLCLGPRTNLWRTDTCSGLDGSTIMGQLVDTCDWLAIINTYQSCFFLFVSRPSEFPCDDNHQKAKRYYQNLFIATEKRKRPPRLTPKKSRVTKVSFLRWWHQRQPKYHEDCSVIVVRSTCISSYSLSLSLLFLS